MAKKTPLKIIRAKCLDCAAGSPTEVRYCTTVKCPLWYHRFGKNPGTVKRKRPEWVDPEWILNRGAKSPDDEDEDK